MFEKRDFIFALVLHLAVIFTIFILNTWRLEHKPVPERTIKVNMVSLENLQAMMKQSKTKVTAKEKPKPKAKPQKKPKPKPKKEPKPKAITAAKARLKPKKKVVDEDPNYDPFAPLESKPKKQPIKKVSGEKVLKDLLKGQLSEQELNSYILGMQKAVSEQWKVPTEMGKVKDVLVELKLYRTGEVADIRILESSGSAMMDETLKKAIYAAAPFKVPDKQFELFKTNQIRFYPLK